MAANSALATSFPFNRVAIAVSGGADSMALLLLADAWAKKNESKIIALTVDHALRAESAAEAKQVGEWCERLGIEHHILKLQDSGFRIQGKQEEARHARYHLLTQWCKSHGYSALATAHHRGDQAETLFFRLGRGSGLLGLSCIAPSSTLDGITLLRPLLDIPKSALIAYLQSKKQSWIEDPSNYNPRYTRSRLRKHLQELEDFSSIEERAAKLATFYGRMRLIIEQEVAKSLAHCVSMDGAVATLHHQQFQQLPSETAKLLLAELITTLNGDDHPPRSVQLERLSKHLREEQFDADELAGLRFVRNSQEVIISAIKT